VLASSSFDVCLTSCSPHNHAQTYAPEYNDCTCTAHRQRARFAYSSDKADGLSFPEGALITLYDHRGQWWRGEYNGTSGRFPASYVELLEGDAVVASTNKIEPPKRPPTIVAPEGPLYVRTYVVCTIAHSSVDVNE
jgi:hypothetical protein